MKYDCFRMRATLLGSTAKAFHVRIGDVTCWLPRSQVQRNDAGAEYALSVPRWLAELKGLPCEDSALLINGSTLEEWHEVGEDVPE